MKTNQFQAIYLKNKLVCVCLPNESPWTNGNGVKYNSYLHYRNFSKIKSRYNWNNMNPEKVFSIRRIWLTYEELPPKFQSLYLMSKLP